MRKDKCKETAMAVLTVLLVLLSGCTRFLDTDKDDNVNWDFWLGEYTYYEFAEPDVSVWHHIGVFEKDGEYYADYTSGGYSDEVRLRCRLEGEQMEIALVYIEALVDNMHFDVQEGEVLLRLEYDGASILTFWEAEYPILYEMDDTDVYFVKTGRVYRDDTNEDNSQSDEMGIWIGNYNFAEFMEPNIVMDSNITVYKKGEVYYAYYYIDGFQTLLRARCRLEGNRESVDLVFEKYLPVNIFDTPFKQGDILFRLEYDDGNILTAWEQQQPLLEENEEKGIRFVKVDFSF